MISNINMNIIIYVMNFAQKEPKFHKIKIIYVKKNVQMIHHMKIPKIMNVLKNVRQQTFSVVSAG